MLDKLLDELYVHASSRTWHWVLCNKRVSLGATCAKRLVMQLAQRCANYASPVQVGVALDLLSYIHTWCSGQLLRGLPTRVVVQLYQLGQQHDRPRIVATAWVVAEANRSTDIWDEGLAQAVLGAPLGRFMINLLILEGIRHGACLAERVEMVLQKKQSYTAEVVYHMCRNEPANHQVMHLVMLHLPTLVPDQDARNLVAWLAQHQPGEVYFAGLGHMMLVSCQYTDRPNLWRGLASLVGVSDPAFKASVVRFAGQNVLFWDPDHLVQLVQLVASCLDANLPTRRAFLGDFLHHIAPIFARDACDVLCKVVLDLMVHTKPGSHDDDVACPARRAMLAKVMERLLSGVESHRATSNRPCDTVCDKLESCLGNICRGLKGMTRPASPVKRKHDQT